MANDKEPVVYKIACELIVSERYIMPSIVNTTEPSKKSAAATFVCAMN